MVNIYLDIAIYFRSDNSYFYKVQIVIKIAYEILIIIF